jgi:hypothetical protein
MDAAHSNKIGYPNNTLLTYTLPADGQGEGERRRVRPAWALTNGVRVPCE